MTNFGRGCLFNDYRLLDIFPGQVAFTKKVESGNIKFIQNSSPFGIADFAESVLRCEALEVLKVVWGTSRLASSANLAIA